MKCLVAHQETGVTDPDDLDLAGEKSLKNGRVVRPGSRPLLDHRREQAAAQILVVPPGPALFGNKTNPATVCGVTGENGLGSILGGNDLRGTLRHGEEGVTVLKSNQSRISVQRHSNDFSGDRVLVSCCSYGYFDN